MTLNTNAASATFDTKNVGTNKTVTVSGLGLSGAGAGNYTIGAQTTLANISAASATVTALNSNKVYGASLVLSGTAFTRSGALYDGDTLTNVSLASAGTPAAATVGSYTIVPGAAQGIGLTNYLIGYSNGTLTVTAHALSVVAGSATRVFGQPNPVFTGTITGIQNGDDITASYDTAATTGSPVGTYDIVPTLIGPGSLLANYSATPTNGLLTIIDAPRLLGISEALAGTFVLEWQVYPARTYRFEYKNTLSAPDWIALGTNTAASLNLAITNDAHTDFYRVYRALDVTP